LFREVTSMTFRWPKTIYELRARGVWLMALIALGSASIKACGVGEGERPALAFAGASALTDPCRSVGDVELKSIEHFELGIGRLWWVSSDGTGQMERTPSEHEREEERWLYSGREPPASEIAGGRCGVSRYALNIKATGMEIFGGAFGKNFFPETFDASDWDGVAFWGRRGEDSGSTLFFAISEKHTDQNDGSRLFEDREPFCEENPVDPLMKCDRFGVGVGLEKEWQFFKVPFSRMRQRGFGIQAPEMDLSALIGVNISFEIGDWDIWMDDVAFYREKR
jgi:hypothetical protein